MLFWILDQDLTIRVSKSKLLEDNKNEHLDTALSICQDFRTIALNMSLPNEMLELRLPLEVLKLQSLKED